MFSQQILSRAFKNRFVELHFDQIPPNELEIILGKICQMPPTYCEKIIRVMTDLQRKRKNTAAFAGKKGIRQFERNFQISDSDKFEQRKRNL